MIKAEVSLDRILGTFAPGAICSLGVWYSHRLFLLVYFPNLNGVEDTSSNIEIVWIKLAIFIIASFSVGLVINQMADVGVALLFSDEGENDKSRSPFREFVRRIIRDITLTQFRRDPRVFAIERYRASRRNEQFFDLAQSWCFSERETLGKPSEAIIAHQHLVTRLTILSPMSSKVLAGENFNWIFSASLFITFVFLLVNSVVSFFTYNFAAQRMNPNDVGFGPKLLILGCWLAITAFGYSLSLRAESKFKKKVVFQHLPHYFLVSMLVGVPMVVSTLPFFLDNEALLRFAQALFDTAPSIELVESWRSMFLLWSVRVLLPYLGVLVFAYLLKRRFKNYCQRVVTLALHFNALEKKGLLGFDVDGDHSIASPIEMVSIATDKSD